MSNELTEVKIQTLKTIEEKGLDSLIKPLTKEVSLFDTYVAGTYMISSNEKIDKNEELILIKEPNEFDDFEVSIYNKNKQKIGYLPELYNVTISNLLEAGKKICARVKETYCPWISKVGFDKNLVIMINVYMVDY